MATPVNQWRSSPFFVTSLEDGYLPYQVSCVIKSIGFILFSVIVIVFHLFLLCPYPSCWFMNEYEWMTAFTRKCISVTFPPCCRMISLRPSPSMAISRTCIMVAKSFFLQMLFPLFWQIQKNMFPVYCQDPKFTSSFFFVRKLVGQLGNSISMVFLMHFFLWNCVAAPHHRHLNLDRRTGFVKADRFIVEIPRLGETK